MRLHSAFAPSVRYHCLPFLKLTVTLFSNSLILLFRSQCQGGHPPKRRRLSGPAVHRCQRAQRSRGSGLDSSGNVYIADTLNARVLKIPFGSSALNCATNACPTVCKGFLQPNAVAVDSGGSVYVIDPAAQKLYRVASSGTQTTLATGLISPSGVAVASDGTAYIAIPNFIMSISPQGILSTFAAGPAQPGGLALDTSGNLFLADVTGNQILKLTGGVQTTVATGLGS